MTSSLRGHGRSRADRVEAVLLWLWRVLPLPARFRRAYLELTHPRFLIGVQALIQDDEQRILIMEHTYRREYRWGLPGGYLQQREEPIAGLAREVLEEIGFRVEVTELLAAGVYSSYQLDLLYRARIVGGTPRLSNEICDWRYAGVAELEHVLPNQCHLLRKAGILTTRGTVAPNSDRSVR